MRVSLARMTRHQSRSGLEATMRLLLEDPNPEVREEAAKFLELWLSQSQEATAVE